MSESNPDDEGDSTFTLEIDGESVEVTNVEIERTEIERIEDGQLGVSMTPKEIEFTASFTGKWESK